MSQAQAELRPAHLCSIKACSQLVYSSIKMIKYYFLATNNWIPSIQSTDHNRHFFYLFLLNQKTKIMSQDTCSSCSERKKEILFQGPVHILFKSLTLNITIILLRFYIWDTLWTTSQTSALTPPNSQSLLHTGGGVFVHMTGKLTTPRPPLIHLNPPSPRDIRRHVISFAIHIRQQKVPWHPNMQCMHKYQRSGSSSIAQD